MFFDIGFSELVLISLLALIVLGPKRLPEAARAAGKMVAKLRDFISNVRSDLDSGMQSEELVELRRLKEEFNETRQLLQESSKKLIGGISDEFSDSDFFDDKALKLAGPKKKKGKGAKKRKAVKKKTGKKKVGKKAAKTKKTAKKKKTRKKVRRG
ncbi:MAG: hypothetical protein BMS9Abin11_1572 [Gammaproteobacteria bacterium]|nr:MAG: hypothetical protein BMS9Abin11_1572 [Gammaproteobacteria bacterium]